MKTFNSNFFMLLLCFISTIASGQIVSFKTKSNLINRFPKEASGYLILNQYDNPDVVLWEITFLRPEFNSMGQLINLTPERIVDVRESYFTDEVEISENSGSHGFMSIIGYNSLNNIVVSDGPIGYDCVGCDSELFCSPGCEGKTYAYEIDVFGPPSSSGPNGGYGTIMFGSTVKPDGSAYYEYFSQSEFLTKTYPQNQVISDHYGFPYNYLIQIPNGYSYNPANSDNVIRIPASSIPPSVVYKNKNGVPITGNVYGIKKSQGIWNHYNNMYTDIVTNGESFCNLGFSSAINFLNGSKSDWIWDSGSPWSEATHIQQTPGINTRPDLVCDGTNWNVFGQPNSTTPIGVEPSITEPCKWVYEYTTGTTTISDQYGNVLWFVDNGVVFMSADCITTGTVSDPNSPWQDWPNLYEYMTLSPTAPNNTNGPIILNKNDNTVKYAISGLPVLAKDFEAGLYHVLFQFPDMTYISRYIEFEQQESMIDLMSNHLISSASPVPVVDDVFILNLESDIDLDFSYKLVTTSGTVLYEKEYNLRNTDKIRDYIQIEGFNQTGILINQFLFTDGSSKSFSISKL